MTMGLGSLFSLVGLITGMTPLAAALAPGGGLPTAPARQDVTWQESLPTALRLAAQRPAPLLLFFRLQESDFCEQLRGETFASEGGAAELAHFVCVDLRVDRAEGRELVQRFGVTTLPTLVFLDAQGHAEDAIEGFIDPAGFVPEVQRIRRGEKTVSDWRRRAALAPDDLDVRLRLALQLEHVGQVPESLALQESIKDQDPEGESAASAQLMLYDVFAIVRGAASDPSDPSTYDLDPLYLHMPRVTPTPILYEGWKWISDIERQRGERERERASLQKVWTHAAPGQARLSSGLGLVRRYSELEAELSQAERRLCLAVAEQIAVEASVLVEPNLRAFVQHGRALALDLNGRRTEALSAARAAAALDPEHPAHQALLERLRREPGEAAGKVDSSAARN